jgi:hypothetical protein
MGKQASRKHAPLPVEIYNPVMMLTDEARKDRALLNETVLTGAARDTPPGLRINMTCPLPPIDVELLR